MSFKTQQSGSVPGPKKLELKEKTLIEEIRVLGIRFEETKNALKEIKKRKSRVKDVKEELKKLEERKGKLHTKTLLLADKVQSREKELFILEGRLSMEKKDIEKKSSEEQDKADIKLLAANKLVEVVKDDLSKLNKRAEVIRKQKENTVKEVKELKESKETLQEEVEELEKTKGTLSIKKSVVTTIKGKIDSLENNRISLEKEIKNIKENKLEVLADYDIQKKKFDKFNNESSRIMKEFEEKMAKKVLELDKRIGLLSEKEGWIKGKEKDLRRAKKELEKHFNRKITHIII